MTDSERAPQYRTTNSNNNSNELLVCFASSSMKLSSKSILSPARTRDPTPLSLSNSRSRRLRTNGSIKAGQASPMFPKKRGCSAFENPEPEPSSPKVTCIGQVRVKTKKQDSKMRDLSRRRGTGEVSFRKTEQQKQSSSHEQGLNRSQSKSNCDFDDGVCLAQRNQRWVHLPLTICEGFSCLFPCLRERGREEKGKEGESSSGGSCGGAVFARWFVALEDGDGEGERGGKGREIELVVGGEEEKSGELKERTLRRHVVEEDEKWEIKEEEEGRVSTVCIPPKNALLLMRCRSDPLQMSALANRIWESPLPPNQEEEEEEEEEDVKVEISNGEAEFVMVEKDNEVCEMCVSDEEQEHQEAETKVITEMQQVEEEEENENLDMNEALQEEIQEMILEVFDASFNEAVVDQEAIEDEKDANFIQEERKESDPVAAVLSSDDSDSERETLEEETQEKETQERVLVTHERSEPGEEIERERSVLPDCLVLMMCEPKLSMEVSKETWVCNTDFIRCLPQRRVNPNKGPHQPKKTDSNQPRSSCSLPAPPSAVASMAAMIEQKLMNAVAYEPLVLTRCKSAPMRTAAQLAPNAYFWKGRKLEPYRRATLGVGVGV